MDHHCLIAEDAAREPLLMSRRFDVALHNINQGVCFFDSERRLILANRRYAEIYALPFDAIRPGMSFAEIVELRVAAGSAPVEGLDQYRLWADVIRAGDEPADSVITLTNGRIIAIHLRIMPDLGWVATHEDITERRRAEHRLAHMARHDPLTGLPNRALLREVLERRPDRRARARPIAVLCLDLDGFKNVNDRFGHPAGDALLCAVADRLRASIRKCDLAVRLGGDEFAVIQAGTRQPDDAIAMAKRLIEEIGRPYRLDPHLATIGTSIGIAWVGTEGRGTEGVGAEGVDREGIGTEEANKDGERPEFLLKAADQALYRAKAAGKGRYCLFAPAMEAERRRRHAVERDIRRALDNGEFELFYQPTLDARTRALTGFEALARWRHPGRGLIPPADFIPVCEETGLINPLGAWALREATREAARWPDALRVAVNLSAAQFRAPGLMATIRDALAGAGLPPRRLEVEITETVLLRHTPENTAVLHELRDAGVGVALDDFGTGHSSIGYLRGFPFDRIKIDGSFVRDLGRRPNARAIVRSVAQLGHALDMAITAEGVETPEQEDILRAEGCDELQGYLFDRPRPAARVAGMIARFHAPAAAPDRAG